MDNPIQDRQHPADSTIFQRWIQIGTGLLQNAAYTVYAKVVSIRGDITNDNPLPVAIASDIEIGKIKLEGDDGAALSGTTSDSPVDVVEDSTVRSWSSIFKGSKNYLRSLLAAVTDTWDPTNHWFRTNATVSASITIGVSGTVLSVEQTRPNDTTQYSTNDIIGTNVAVVGVTNHAGDNYCLVQVASSVIDTILKDQDYISISSIVGTTEANVSAIMTKIDATHFTIPITFVHAYTSGGSIARYAQLDVVGTNGASGYINWMKIVKNSTTTVNALFDVYAHWDPPVPILDNAQFATLYANATKGCYLGQALFVSGGTGSDSAFAMMQNLNTLFCCLADSKRLYFSLVNVAATGYIPTANEKFTFVLGIDKNS